MEGRGKDTEGEIWVRHTVAPWAEGVIIYLSVLLLPSVSKVLVDKTLSLFISLSLLLIVVPATSCFLLDAPHNIFFMYLFFAWLTAFIREHPSPLLLSRQLGLRGLNAATVREHGSNSPALVTLPDSPENNITTRLFISLKAAFFFFYFCFSGKQEQHTSPHDFCSKSCSKYVVSVAMETEPSDAQC